MFEKTRVVGPYSDPVIASCMSSPRFTGDPKKGGAAMPGKPVRRSTKRPARYAVAGVESARELVAGTDTVSAAYPVSGMRQREGFPWMRVS